MTFLLSYLHFLCSFSKLHATALLHIEHDSDDYNNGYYMRTVTLRVLTSLGFLGFTVSGKWLSSGWTPSLTEAS